MKFKVHLELQLLVKTQIFLLLYNTLIYSNVSDVRGYEDMLLITRIVNILKRVK